MMRRWGVVAAAGLALAGCGHKTGAVQAAQPAAQASAQAAANVTDDSQLTVQQLEAKAQAAEADAKRLEAQASQDQTAPPAGGVAHQSLGPGSEKMASGEYYRAVSFEALPGQTYDVDYQAYGYTPVIVVLDPDKKPFSQSTALAGATQISDEIKTDRAGTWYVLLTTLGAGAIGTYDVNVQKVTEQPIG